MKRNAEKQLLLWYLNKKRKPLVLRGARQTGKSTLVRQFAEAQKLNLLEINLERFAYKLRDSFKTLNPNQTLKDIEFLLNKKLDSNTLLFIDEIQAIPEALAVLRYFYEEMPHLPVIAAGSLLEFVFSEHDFSMPVGRIEFLYLGPMTFSEFLAAKGRALQIKNISKLMHQELLTQYREFLIVGGMPEAVQTFMDTKDFRRTKNVQNQILETYRNDFAKYKKRIPELRIEKIYDFIPGSVGRKLKWSEIDLHTQAKELKKAFDLLVKALVVSKVCHTHCGGIPLRAGMNEKVFKTLFLDVGLMSCALGVSLQDLGKKELLISGSLAEQFVGQHLFYRENSRPPELFYWLRENKSQNAEVDYVFQKGVEIIPVEVKSSAAGHLKSLHVFCYEKKNKIRHQNKRSPCRGTKIKSKINRWYARKLYASGYSILCDRVGLGL